VTISPTVSQTISKGEVREIINTRGDTLILMHLEDARMVLSDLLEYEVVDSLLTVYKNKDSLDSNILSMHKDVIVKLTQKTNNLQSIVDNFEQILSNKNAEIEFKDKIIKAQEKEIKKQKRLKIVGFIGSVIIPIFILISLT
jgi:nitric oxide reductase large subunit